MFRAIQPNYVIELHQGEREAVEMISRSSCSNRAMAEEQQLREVAQERRHHGYCQADPRRHRLYIEYGFAKLTKAPVAMLENKEGKFVAPGPETGATSLASAAFADGNLPGTEVPDLRACVYDPAGEKAYPIATMTWMLFPEKMGEEKAKAARDLVEYGLTEGPKSADAMGYIPLPENVVATVREVSQKIQQARLPIDELAGAFGHVPGSAFEVFAFEQRVSNTGCENMASNPFTKTAMASTISGPPSSGDFLRDSLFRSIAYACAVLIILLIAYILWEIGGLALPAMPFDNQIELAWAASLVLVLIVLVFNILARLIGQPKV